MSIAFFAGLEARVDDKVLQLGAIAGIAALGLLPLVYLLSLSIEVGVEHVTKRYLFGLIHVRIAREQFRAEVETERGGDWTYKRVDFDSADERPVMFSAYPFWFWRWRDIDALLSIANESAKWRAANPQSVPARPTRGFGDFIAILWRLSYLGSFVAVIPILVVYTKWGDRAGLVGLATFVVITVILSALLTRSGRGSGPTHDHS